MVSAHDRAILRRLAGRVREIAENPEMEVREQRWLDHNALRGERPMILAFPEGAWDELLPDDSLQCEDRRHRAWERRLRQTVYWWDHIRDDGLIEPAFDINWLVSIGDYGVEAPQIRAEQKGSYVWDPPIKNLARDLDKVRYRELSVDRHGTEALIQHADEIFGDLLPPRIQGSFWWTMGLTWEAAKLIGLEQLMMYMYDDPEGLHRVMEWLSGEHMHFIKWFETEGLLTRKDGAQHIGSGGFGCTDELPQPDWNEGRSARLIDIWGFAESQETTGISPGMFEEFIVPYQAPLMEQFGLNCYGCCEPLHQRLDPVLRYIPRLRRISGSPWVDQKIMKKKIGNDYIFSRKPNPTQVCTMFNEEQIRADVGQTLEIAGHGPLEIIMKDTHTVENNPRRITRWVEIALEEVDRYVSVDAA